MKIRLILIIIVLIIGIVFLAVNIRNTTDVSLMVTSFTDVPTGIALLIAMCSGLLIGFIGGSIDRMIKKTKKDGPQSTRASKRKGKTPEDAEIITDFDARVQMDSKKPKKSLAFWRKKPSK